MKFHSKWITTAEFAGLQPIQVYHKENDRRVLPESPYKNYHVRFRKKIPFGPFTQVTMDISADDYYKLYINGAFVSQGPANAYPGSYRYNHLDITPYLSEGINTFAIHAYYHGEITRSYDSGDNLQGMIADIYVDNRFFCGTDETWKYHLAKEYSGTLLSPHRTQFMENIDFRIRRGNWKEADFPDEGDPYAIVKKDHGHIFQDGPADCVSVSFKRPAQVTALGKGRWLLDFGSEITGAFYAKVRGKRGQTVRILCGEELSQDFPGYARYEMRCNCLYDETCILSGQEDEFDFFDYKAFRYVNVITDCENLDPLTFGAVVRHHPFREACTLSSGVPWAEEIWRLCANTLKWGTQEGFLDCPSREKGQYMGDFTVSGLAYLYLTGDAKLYKKALYDFAKTAKICPGLLCVAPGSLMQEIADFSLQYPMQALSYYQHTQDLDTLRTLYPVLRDLIAYFSRYAGEDGLLAHVDDKWNLIDWPDNLRDGYDLPEEDGRAQVPCHNVLNAHYIGAVGHFEQIQRILGIQAESRLDALKTAFRNAFYDAEKKLFYDTPESRHSSLHANALPVFYDIAPAESWSHLKNFIMEKGLACGTQFSYFVLKALGKMGAYEEERKLLLNDGKHSWINMLKEGATTCFEAWGKDQKWNTSLCHPWSCAPIIVFIEDLTEAFPSDFILRAATIY